MSRTVLLKTGILVNFGITIALGFVHTFTLLLMGIVAIGFPAAWLAGAADGFRTLNLRFAHWKPAASGIFVVAVHGLHPDPKAPPLPGVANLGVRPSLDPNDVNGGRVLLETHCLEWPPAVQAALASAPVPGEAYGKIVRVDLLHKLHDELKYDSLEALTAGIAQDCDNARAWLRAQPASHASVRRQTTRDRI